MERWAGRVAVVTGASMGIGAALAERLVKDGMTVIGCARSLGAIEELAQRVASEKGKLVAMRCDVTKEDDVLAVFKRADDEFGGVDVCVNNAGLAYGAPLLSGSTDDWRAMLEINVLGLSICTREAVKSMRKKGVDDGHIINVGSLAGYRIPGAAPMNFYSATKFAVKSLTEGTRLELRQANSNIRVSAVSPGRVDTQFRPRLVSCTAAEQAEHVKQNQHLVSEDIVDSIVFLLASPPHVQIHDILVRPTQQQN